MTGNAEHRSSGQSSGSEHSRCEISDLPVYSCYHCRGIKTPEEEEKELDKAFDRWLDEH